MPIISKRHTDISTPFISGVCGMNYDGNDYYFRKNILGDILAIHDIRGNLLCRYVYDAWGNHKLFDKNGNAIADNGSTIGSINPFRYRGYYWDRESGLYYLKSRYYDSELGRFISPDDISNLDPESIFGLNLYAYCNNNPVMYTDPEGTFVSTILGGIFGALWGGLAAAFNGDDIGKGMLAGFVSGALAGFAVDLAVMTTVLVPGVGAAIGAGIVVAIVGGFGFGTLGDAAAQSILYGKVDWNQAMVVGAISSVLNLVTFGISSLVGNVVGTSTANLFKMVLPKYTPIWSWLVQIVLGWVLPFFSSFYQEQED